MGKLYLLHYDPKKPPVTVELVEEIATDLGVMAQVKRPFPRNTEEWPWRANTFRVGWPSLEDIPDSECEDCGEPMGDCPCDDLEEDIESPAVECPQCGSLAPLLGALGGAMHHRCRACGWTFIGRCLI